MSRRIIIIVLELYAVGLAVLQSLGGVRTDEAKYLLNIPYPHPPLVRWILHLTETLPFQEMLWRIVFATIVVQAVWLIWDLCRDVSHVQRLSISGMWLLSSAVILQAGSIMVVTLTAVQGLVFMYILYNKYIHYTYNIRIIYTFYAVLWLFSLFTAYQAALFFPIILAIFWKAELKSYVKILFVFGPIVVLALYTLVNPLILASIINAGVQNVELSFFEKIEGMGELWLIGGSGILTLFGIAGMLRSKSLPLIGSFILVSLYVFFSHRLYYAILFTPLFITGIALSPVFLKKSRSACMLFSLTTGLLIALYPPTLQMSEARLTMNNVLGNTTNFLRDEPTLRSGSPQDDRWEATKRDEVLLIHGVFGHEWQYESPWPVRRYRKELEDGAVGIVCLEACGKMGDAWKQVEEYFFMKKL